MVLRNVAACLWLAIELVRLWQHASLTHAHTHARKRAPVGTRGSLSMCLGLASLLQPLLAPLLVHQPPPVPLKCFGLFSAPACFSGRKPGTARAGMLQGCCGRVGARRYHQAVRGSPLVGCLKKCGPSLDEATGGATELDGFGQL